MTELKRHAAALQALARDLLGGFDTAPERETVLASLQEVSDKAFAAADTLTGALSATVEARHRHIRYVLLAMGAALACLLAAAMFGLRQRIVRPLQGLARAAQAFASGRREERVSVGASDEVGELAQSFNRMADAIAHQMGELETFSYSVSHDLRSPLRTVQGYTQLMEKICSDCGEGDAHTYLTRIQAACARMGEIIDDLLDLARISRSELKLADVALSAMAKAVIAQLAQAAPERGLATFVEDGITVTADPGMLRLALENLLGNAWKFTAGRTPARLRVTAQRRNGETVIGIADNGVGFDMSYADKLFHPFERLHRTEEFEGTGIGLATVSRIVHLHGGRVWAEGQLDQGASFFFSLPDQPPGKPPGNQAPAP